MHRAVRALSTFVLVLLLAPLVTVVTAGTAAALGPAAPSLIAPANSATVDSNPTFSWGSVATAATYHFQLSTQPDMSSPAEIVTPNTYATITNDLTQTTWYWRVAS